MLRKTVSLFFICALISNVSFSDNLKPYWIFFKDRGSVDIKNAVAKKIASPSEPKNNSRRAKLLSANVLFDEKDVPVSEEYIQEISHYSGKIRTISRYLNGVSAEIGEEGLANIKKLEFVKEIRPVRTGIRPVEPETTGKVKKPAATETWDTINYGGSFYQLNAINAVKIHNQGYSGKGVKIAVLDSGFDGINHDAFDSLIVESKWDFVDKDSNPSGHNHGTKVLSIMAALDPGNMIGASPYATYLLGRTEIVQGGQELREEEDYLVAGIEWADSLGADIINISLGYTKFDDGTGYSYNDLNGDTAITSIAADAAASRGIAVVTSAGNEGPDPWSSDMWYYVSTPADGDSVIAVGAVDLNGVVCPFSSRGPTSDGRVKPDFMAIGEYVWMVNPSDPDGYMDTESGTSYAAPAVSGAIALIMEVNPLWSSMEIYEKLKFTAVDKGISGADSLYGYGIIDAFAASGLESPEPEVKAFKVYDPYPQPAVIDAKNPRIYFPMDVPVENKTLTMKIFSFSGENIQTKTTVLTQSGSLINPGDTTGSAPYWDGTNFAGEDVSPGIYFYTIRLSGYGTYKGKLMVMR